ncbi:MAG: hypothetical protein RBS68_09610 [Anaerolineales bacterium]|jgi:hypothetical protein|nr:hypothetical protein [Anaerolineales bacterium]
MLFAVLQIFLGFYLIFFYTFLAPAVLGFLVENRPILQKGLQALAFVLTPLLLPFGLAAALMIVIFVFGFMLCAFPIHWLNTHFPFGAVFKAWYRISAKLLTRIRGPLEALLGLTFPTHPANDLSFLDNVRHNSLQTSDKQRQLS